VRKSPVIAAIVIGLLTGCAVNKGSALAASFDEDWAGTPDVTEVRTTGDNPLPFAGSATGELVLADGTQPDRIAQLAGELRGYVADRDNVTGRITADAITLTVGPDQSHDDETLTLWRSLTRDERVLDGDLAYVGADEGARRRLLVTAIDPAAAMAVFQDMVTGSEPGGLHTPVTGARSVHVRTEPRTLPSLHVQTDHEGGVPVSAIAAYEAVRAEFEVVSASIQPDRTTGSKLTVRVGPDDDPDAAVSVARAAAPSLAAAITVTR
jgi:hypothetical protein